MRYLITDICLDHYQSRQKFTIVKHLRFLAKKDSSVKTFMFKNSAIYSSLIEGSGIDYDSYVKNKNSGNETREIKQIDDLIEAYNFAKTHTLNQANLLKVHSIITKNMELLPTLKGKYRNKNVYVMQGSKIIYTGAEYSIVKAEMNKFFKDIIALKKRKKITYNQGFYYASLIHLVFVKIHPFGDGNGRTARLLEKWFLAHFFGNICFSIPSEAYYWHKRMDYYYNLNIGSSYDNIDYLRTTPFLLMLPKSFGISKKMYLS